MNSLRKMKWCDFRVGLSCILKQCETLYGSKQEVEMVEAEQQQVGGEPNSGYTQKNPPQNSNTVGFD